MELSLALNQPLQVLQRTLSIPHYLQYLEYRRRHGSLDVALRLEGAAAKLAYVTAATKGGKFALSDSLDLFMRNQRAANPQQGVPGLDPEILNAMKESDRAR